MNVKEHYKNHLSHFYSWMVGDFDERVTEQNAFFEEQAITAKKGDTALDLGCGHGIQSVALAQMGFSVKSVDSDQGLLDQLRNNKANLSIEIIQDDILNFDSYCKESPALITCMGDTIAHLDSYNDLDTLFKKMKSSSTQSTKIVLSFRDYSQVLTDTSRFIPVKSDDSRMLTCFLEYFDDHVIVTDLLYEKEAEGWVQKVSSYKKLRISEKMIVEKLKAVGFTTLTHLHKRISTE